MPKLIVQPESKAYAQAVLKGTLKETSKAVDTDWFTSNIEPTQKQAIHRIYIRLATESVVNIQLDDGTNTDITLDLNEGSALSANSLYVFDVHIPAGYSYNLQHKTGTQNINCWIVEGGLT